MDVTNKESIRQGLISLKKAFGSIDILVNNAGIMPASDIDAFKVDEWDAMVDVNIKGVLYVTDAVLPELIQQKSGHIINLSSIAGRELFKGLAVYCGTKHFIAAFQTLCEWKSVKNTIYVLRAFNPVQWILNYMSKSLIKLTRMVWKVCENK